MNFGRNAGKRKERFHARIDAGKNGNQHCNDNTQAYRIAQRFFGGITVAFAQAQSAKRIAAVANEHAQRHEDGHDGHGCRGNRKARFAHGLAKEHRINNVISTVNQHAHNGGNGELHNELRDRASAHASRTLIAFRHRAGFVGRFAHRALFKTGALLLAAPLLLKLFCHVAYSLRYATV